MDPIELDTPAVAQPIIESQSTEQESTGPASMLEAIESGLKVEAGDNSTDTPEGRARDEAGRFAAKAAEVKEDPAEANPVDPTAKADDDLAMPEGLSHKAQERFSALVSRVKEREAQASAANETIGAFREMIQSTGASPQEFSQAIDYMKMVKGGDLEGALRVIDDQRRMISLALGKALPGADPLADFPDLRQRVDGYQMDEQTAIELARTRTQQNHQQEQQRRSQAQQQQTEQSQQARQHAVAQIDQLGQQWAKTDPDFTFKEDIILKQLPEIARNFPASMWPQQVRILYNTLSSMPAQQRNSNPAPLRPSGQGGGARQPKTMLDAVEMGLGYSGG